jgi:lysophospholipase
MVPGWGEHAGRSAGLAAALNPMGYAVYAYDHEGHGHSDGARAVIREHAQLMADLGRFLMWVRERQPGAPVFLCGHSMGGNLIAHWVAGPGHGIAGAILMGAALQVSPRIPRLKVALAHALGRLLPALPLHRITSGSKMTRDPAQAARFDADPLNHHGPVRAGTGRQLLLASERAPSLFPQIQLPLLILQGLADEVVAPEGAQALVDQASSTDKSLITFPDARHDLLHEHEGAEVLAHIRQWLDGRTTPTA